MKEFKTSTALTPTQIHRATSMRKKGVTWYVIADTLNADLRTLRRHVKVTPVNGDTRSIGTKCAERALQYWTRGWHVERIAEKLGISKRTVFRYIEKWKYE